MKDFSAGLKEAGYGSFDLGEIKSYIFTTKRKTGRTERERFEDIKEKNFQDVTRILGKG
jgi:hypothetical protein